MNAQFSLFVIIAIAIMFLPGLKFLLFFSAALLLCAGWVISTTPVDRVYRK